MAISLKNVSTYELIACAKIKKEFDLVYKEIYEWLFANKIDNYLRLQCLLDEDINGLSELARNQIQTYFNRVLNKVNKANEVGKEPEIFTFDCYDKLDIDRETLEYTDNNTKGSVLPLGSPLNKTGNVALNKLGEFSIKEIIGLLGVLSSTNLGNGLTIINELRRTSCLEVFRLVEFYREQVIRQYFETDERGINLFDLNRDAKRQIVNEQITQIIEYIVEESREECFWGVLGPTQKRHLTTVINSKRKEETTVIAQEMTKQRICDYVTLGELETGIFNEQEVVTVVGGKIKRVKEKPVARFVVK